MTPSDPMRIAVIGNGKMARAVEESAPEMGIEVVRCLSRYENDDDVLRGPWIDDCQVLIDFSTAAAVPANVSKALKARVPIVIGTTGWADSLEDVRRQVEEAQGAALYGANFSLGMQTLFLLTRRACEVLRRLPDYDPYLWEAHHRSKIDAPSGTAQTLSAIIGETWGQPVTPASIRAGFIPGTHVVGFDSPDDTLELQHVARSRRGFARGALTAARWIQGRQGFFTVRDLIEENLK